MTEPAVEIARLQRAVARERQARIAAEDIAEATMTRLFDAVTRSEEEHRAMRALASAATHDIKNPLASIIGFVHLLQSDRLEEPLRGEVMGRLIRATTYAQDMIDGLMEVLFASAQVEPPVPIDLVDLLAGVAVDLRARHPGVVLHQQATGRVMGHPTETRRLFDNLTENAARYAGSDPVVITVERVDTRPDGVVVRVGDNGSGVAQGDRDRIFEIFQRGTGQPPGTGSGVGLAVAQRIARTVHGDVWLDDRPAPDGGAAFLVRLPAAG